MVKIILKNKIMFSYWEKSALLSNIDVAIIGSGIVGMSAAYQLKTKDPKLKIVIFERGFLPEGATTKNAGFACFGSISELMDDLRNQPKDKVLALVEKRYKGLLKMREILGDDKINYESFGGYEVFDNQKDFETCKAKIEEFNKDLKSIIGENVYSTDHSKFGFKNFDNIIKNKSEGQIHSGFMFKNFSKLLQQLEVDFYYGCDVGSIESEKNKTQIVLKNGDKIEAKKTILCTNAFAKKFLPDYDITPGRGQVIITTPIPGLAVKGSFHYDAGYYYFRNVNDRVLLGGGRNLDYKQEETTDFGFSEIVQNKLLKLLKENIIPDHKFEIDMRWSGIMAFGKEKTPIVQKCTDNVFCAVRMGGMGVALGSLTGEEVANLVLEEFKNS